MTVKNIKPSDEILITLQRINGVPLEMIARQFEVTHGQIRRSVRRIINKASPNGPVPMLGDVYRNREAWDRIVRSYAKENGLTKEQNPCQECGVFPAPIQAIDELGSPISFCCAECQDKFNSR